MGIAGTGTGALAGLLQAAGHNVTGSDEHVYPPMRDKLQQWGIPVQQGFSAAHLQPHPDLVVVGNVIRRDNPEAAYAREAQLTSMSMPQAVAEFGIGDRHSVVVAGTHGKTTTTALIAHLLTAAGRDPGFLVGGAMVGYRDSFHLGEGGVFVVEGDEYDTAYFDKGAKFLHYRAKTLVITSLEFDHADIFANVEAVEAAFTKLIVQMPAGGHVIVWQGAQRARRLLQSHGNHLKVTTYGTSPSRGEPLGLLGRDVALGPFGVRFQAEGMGLQNETLQVGLWGTFSAHNALAACAVAHSLGLSVAEIRAGLASFAGVERRLQQRGTFAGRTIVDDFAHHPTAVRATLQAARSRWPQQRLWAIFEPRSATSRRNVFADEYRQAFAECDCTIISHHPRLKEVPEAERFSPEKLAEQLCTDGKQAWALQDSTQIAAHVAKHSAPGDVILVLSNGDFDGLLPKLCEQTYADAPVVASTRQA